MYLLTICVDESVPLERIIDVMMKDCLLDREDAEIKAACLKTHGREMWCICRYLFLLEPMAWVLEQNPGFTVPIEYVDS